MSRTRGTDSLTLAERHTMRARYVNGESASAIAKDMRRDTATVSAVVRGIHQIPRRAATSGPVCDQPHCDYPARSGSCRWCRQAAACNESPLALTGGRWVSRRGIQVWEAGS